jgi:methylated-DNA-[protein]-cysteine S-methyltransferase
MTPLPDHLLDSLVSEAVREGLADAVFTRVSTPIGRLLVVQGRQGIVRIGFQEENDDATLAQVAERIGPRVLASDRELADARERLVAYLEGDLPHPDLPYDLSMVRSDFRRQVLETLAHEVGPGEVVTYGGLAERAGRPRAARAAGTACATNPVPLVVPCHRVLPGGGGVGNYGGGAHVKRALLELEGSISPRS